jgi:predicted secreted Zn-dependent protease
MMIEWRASYSLTSNGGDWTGHVQSVTVTNTMQPSLSWVVSGKATASVLEHEQAHFDLNEVYRRKLEAVLPCLQAKQATKQGVIDALNTSLHQKANEILAQLQVAQARYDAETRHGNDTAGQARWEAQIAAWLLNPTAAP